MKCKGMGVSLSAVIVVVTVVTLNTSPVHAWLPCDRSFHFLGATPGTLFAITFWETTWGECESYRMHYVWISPEGQLITDSVVHLNKETFVDRSQFANWYNGIQRLRWRDSAFQGPFRSAPTVRVSPPAYDSSFWTVWLDTLTSVNTGVPKIFRDSLWLDSHFDSPAFDRPAELVYRYPFGIYKNYQIAEVILVRDYVFVLTDQPVVTSEDTYDGVLIYRVKNASRKTGAR